MIWLRFQECKNSRYFNRILFVGSIVLVIMVVFAGFKIKERIESPAVYIEGYEYLNFDRWHLVLSEYQEARDNFHVKWNIKPEELTSESPVLVEVSLTNEGKSSLVWGDRGEVIFLEKYEEGKWYYNSKALPEKDTTEEVKYLHEGETRQFKYQLRDNMEAGTYRFTALFYSGLSAGYFEIS